MMALAGAPSAVTLKTYSFHSSPILRTRSALATASSAAASAAAPKRPSTADLRKVFAVNMVPFVAFGFVDNTVLIYAGDAIDGTVGVAFGLSSLAAAAMGGWRLLGNPKTRPAALAAGVAAAAVASRKSIREWSRPAFPCKLGIRRSGKVWLPSMLSGRKIPSSDGFHCFRMIFCVSIVKDRTDRVWAEGLEGRRGRQNEN